MINNSSKYKAKLRTSLRHPATVHFQGAEAQMMADAIVQHGITHYLDIGCFHGGLAREVISRSTNELTVRLVEAIPEHMEVATEQVLKVLPQERLTTTPGAAVGNGDTRPRTFTHPNSSPSGAGFSDTCKLEGDHIDVTMHQIDSLLVDTPLDRLMCKIDAEYEDLPIVESMSALVPLILHFEIIDLARYDKQTRPALAAMGYASPALPKKGSHLYYSLMVVRGSQDYKLVAFQPFEIYDNTAPRKILDSIPWIDPRSRRYAEAKAAAEASSPEPIVVSA